jgi:hypothetical protein
MTTENLKETNNWLKNIVGELSRIANALEEQNKPKGLGYPWKNYGVEPLNCYSKDELPLPTANSDLVKAAYNSDYLSTASSDLTNKLYD